MTENYSLSDIAAVTDGNKNNMWGGDWLAYILLFALFGGCFGGFGGLGAGGILPWLLLGNGGFGGCGNCATQADLAAGFNNSAVLGNLNDLALGQANIQQTLCQGFGGVNTAIGNLGYNLSHQISDCCCSTKQAIADVKYTIGQESCETRHAMYNNTRDIIENANANSRAILDFLTQDKISTLTAENQSLKLAASQSNQNAVLMAAMDANKAEILRRTGAECPTAAYIVQPPTPVTFNNGCGSVGHGCGCGGF